MNLTELLHSVSGHKRKRRVGRGKSSGHGKLCGRGGKGQTARVGFTFRLGFEGGQMPLFRRLPKRGFNNANFRTEFTPVNLKQLKERFKDGAEINLDSFAEAGIIKDFRAGIKILGEGEPPKNIKISAHRFSASAKQKIEAAGGKVTELAPAETDAQKKERADKRKAKRAKKGATAAKKPEAAAEEA